MRVYLILFVLLLCVGIIFFLAPAGEHKTSRSTVLPTNAVTTFVTD